MEIVALIFSVVNGIIAIVTVVICFTEFYEYFFVGFVVFAIILLFTEICFFKKTKNIMNLNKHNLIRLAKEIQWNKVELLCFYCYNNIWQLENTDIIFDLAKYAFKKSFIISAITRNLRYKAVSNKLPLKQILKKNLVVPNKRSLVVVFVDGNKKSNKEVVKNGVSKHTLLSKTITKSKFYEFYFHNRSYQVMKKISTINERIYLSYK